MNVLRNDTGNRHHGELLKQFVFDNKVKVTYLAKGLGIHRTDVYRLYKQEVLPKSDLDLLEKLIGFKPSQSVTKVDEPTTKKDTSDQDPDTDVMVAFAGRVSIYIAKTKELSAMVAEHEVRFDKMFDIIADLRRADERLEKAIDQLKKLHHV